MFPDFDSTLRAAFRREIELFFGSIIRENRSVLDLLAADYTFVNERLARHYGIPGVYGSQFRRVELGPDLDMRRAAAQGLAETAGHEHLPVLRALAVDADWDIRHSAARGLGRWRTAETRDLLLTLARDVESVVAATARAALEQSQVPVSSAA